MYKIKRKKSWMILILSSLLFALNIFYINATNTGSVNPILVGDKMAKTISSYEAFRIAAESSGIKSSYMSPSDFIDANAELSRLYTQFLNDFKSEAKNIGATVDLDGKDIVIKFDGSTGFGSFVKDRSSTVLGILQNGNASTDVGMRINVVKDISMGGADGWFDGSKGYLSAKSFFSADLNKPSVEWLHWDHEISIHGATEMMKKIGVPDLFSARLNNYFTLPIESFKYSDWGMQFDEIQAHKSNFNDLKDALAKGEAWARTPENIQWLSNYATRSAMMSDLFVRKLSEASVAPANKLIVEQDANRTTGEKYDGVRVTLDDGYRSFDYSLSEVNFKDYSKLNTSAQQKIIRDTLASRLQDVIGVTQAYKKQIWDGISDLYKTGAIDYGTTKYITDTISWHHDLMKTPTVSTGPATQAYNNTINMRPATPSYYQEGLTIDFNDPLRARLQVAPYDHSALAEQRLPMNIDSAVSSKISVNVNAALIRAESLSVAGSYSPASEVRVNTPMYRDSLDLGMENIKVSTPEKPMKTFAEQTMNATMISSILVPTTVQFVAGMSSLRDEVVAAKGNQDLIQQSLDRYTAAFNKNATNFAEAGVVFSAGIKGMAIATEKAVINIGWKRLGIAAGGVVAGTIAAPVEGAIGIGAGVYFAGDFILDFKNNTEMQDKVFSFLDNAGGRLATVGGVMLTEINDIKYTFSTRNGLARALVQVANGGSPILSKGLDMKARLDMAQADIYKEYMSKVAAEYDAIGGSGAFSKLPIMQKKSIVENNLKRSGERIIPIPQATATYTIAQTTKAAKNVNYQQRIYDNGDGTVTYEFAKSNGRSIRLNIDEKSILGLVCPECKPITKMSLMNGLVVGGNMDGLLGSQNFRIQTKEGTYNFSELASMRTDIFVQSAGGMESIVAGFVDNKKGYMTSTGLYLDWLDKGTGAIIDYNTKVAAYNNIKYPIPSTEFNYQQQAIRSLGNFLDSFIQGTAVTQANVPFYNLGIPSQYAKSNAVFTTIDSPEGFAVSRVIASATYSTEDGSQHLSSTQQSTPNLNLQSVYDAYFQSNKNYTGVNSQSSVTTPNGGSIGSSGSGSGSVQVIGLHMGSSTACVGCVTGSQGSSAQSYYHGMGSLSDDELGADLGTNAINDATWRNWVLPSGSIMPF